MAVASGKEISITRIFDAPRESVWRAFTDAKLLAKWWGPEGFTNTILEMSVKPGGVWRFVMHGPDGTDYENEVVYDEVVKPERIAYRHVSGPQFRVIVNFTKEDGKTNLSYRMAFQSAAELKQAVEKFHAVEGLNQTINRLGAELEPMRAERAASEIVVTHVFDAPADAVWKAWTEPDRMMQWWGPKTFTSPSCRMDFRVGGKYLFCMRSPEGKDYWSTGTYREIIPLKRIVYSDSFADANGNVVPATHYGFGSDFPLENTVTARRSHQTHPTPQGAPSR